MKRKSTFNKRTKSNKALPITLTVVGVLMTAIVVWFWFNEWDVNKSLNQIGIGSEQQSEEPGIDPEEVEEPEEEPVIEEEEPVDEEEPVIEEDPAVEEPPAEVEEPVTETPVPVKKPEQKPEKPVTPAPPKNDKPPVTVKPPGTPNKSGYIEGQKLPDKPKYVNGIIIANKTFPLPSTYAPGESKEARVAFDEMAAEALLSDIKLTAFSTYRAYDYQVGLYDRYVKKDGVEAADRYSARPGYSEHQTGLAFDIGEVNFEKHWASSSFGDTTAGKWVAANAHRYGFILRYPKGKESITGYMHESWHFRYVGKSIAEDIYSRNITLEEYLGLK